MRLEDAETGCITRYYSHNEPDQVAQLRCGGPLAPTFLSPRMSREGRGLSISSSTSFCCFELRSLIVGNILSIISLVTYDAATSPRSRLDAY